jgi:hypothetical protein
LGAIADYGCQQQPSATASTSKFRSESARENTGIKSTREICGAELFVTASIAATVLQTLKGIARRGRKGSMLAFFSEL